MNINTDNAMGCQSYVCSRKTQGKQSFGEALNSAAKKSEGDKPSMNGISIACLNSGRTIVNVSGINEDTIAWGGKHTGFSYTIQWAADSCGNNPVMIARGYHQGVAYEKRIHINDIDPRNATYLEMRALGAYLDANPANGPVTIPNSMSGGFLGLNDRADFLVELRNAISDLRGNPVGWAQDRVALYQNSLRAFENFFNNAHTGNINFTINFMSRSLWNL